MLDEEKPLSEEAGTIIRSVGELSQAAHRGRGRRPARRREPSQAPVDVQEIEKSNRILKVLTKVAETLIAVRPVEEVLQQVMDIVFEHMPADRGFLMLEDEEIDAEAGADGGQAPHHRRRAGADHRSPRRSPTA